MEHGTCNFIQGGWRNGGIRGVRLTDWLADCQGFFLDPFFFFLFFFFSFDALFGPRGQNNRTKWQHSTGPDWTWTAGWYGRRLLRRLDGNITFYGLRCLDSSA
jgi:hypothetical protein